MMLKKTCLLAVIVSLICLSFVTVFTQTSYAVTASEWNAGNIIDDALFMDKDLMSVAQIQAWLNSKVGTGYYGRIAGQCDTNGIRTSELGGGIDYNGDGRVTRAEYGQTFGNPAPFTCLKDFYEVPKTTPGAGIPANNYGGKPRPTGSRSAAQLIWDAAQKYNISPKVLLVKLGTESAGPLTSDDWPFLRQYTYAMGAHCPDSGPRGSANCDSDYAGFSIQISEAASLLRWYLDSMSQPWWSYRKPYQTNSILWNVVQSGCGASNVFIENKATAALYTYTPYQPNQAALNNMYGTGDGCSAYGNRNFWRTYNDWFGSTKFPQPIGGSLNRQTSNGRIYLVTGNIKFYIPSNSILENYRLNRYTLIPTTDTKINSYTNGGTLSNLIWNNNGVFLVNNGYKHHVSSQMCTAWGFACWDGTVTKRLGTSFDSLYFETGGSITALQLDNSVYYKMEAGKRLPFANEKSLLDSGLDKRGALHVSMSNSNQTLGKLIITTPGFIKFSPKASIYYFNGSNFYSISTMSLLRNLGMTNLTSIDPPVSSYNTIDNVVITSEIGYFLQSNTSDSFVISNGNKLLLTTDQKKLWPEANFVTGLDPLLTKLSSSKLNQFVKSDATIYKLSLDTFTKDPIPSMDDFYRLGGNSTNISLLPSAVLTIVPDGLPALGSGRLIRIGTGNTIYIVNNNELLPIPNMSTLKAYITSGIVSIYSENLLAKYSIGDVIRNTKLSDNSVGIPYDNQLLYLSPSNTNDYGAKLDLFKKVNNYVWISANKKSLDRFMRNVDNHRIYYASGNAIHYVSSYDSFIKYGGNTTTVTSVNSAIINLFVIGKSI